MTGTPRQLDFEARIHLLLQTFLLVCTFLLLNYVLIQHLEFINSVTEMIYCPPSLKGEDLASPSQIHLCSASAHPPSLVRPQSFFVLVISLALV